MFVHMSNKTKLENRQSAITKCKLNRDKSFNKVHYFSNISTEIYPTSQLVFYKPQYDKMARNSKLLHLVVNMKFVTIIYCCSMYLSRTLIQ